MSEIVFEALGIEPTTDEIAIRRAYARCLKQVRGDADRDAFMRLREAYEEAMAQARLAEREDDEDAGDNHEEDRQPVARPVVATMPVAEPDVPVTTDEALPRIGLGEVADFREAFFAAVENADSRTAARRLTEALARGLVSIGQEGPMAAALFDAACKDDALTLEELDGILGAFGGREGNRRLSDSARNLQAKIQALRWHARIQERARAGGNWFGRLLRRRFRRSPRVAAAILRGRALGLRGGDLDALREEMALARLHAPWLGDRINLARLEKVFRRFERRVDPSAGRWLLIGATMVATGVLVRIPRFEIWSLVAFGVTLMLIGFWFFTLVGALLLGLIGFLEFGHWFG